MRQNGTQYASHQAAIAVRRENLALRKQLSGQISGVLVEFCVEWLD